MNRHNHLWDPHAVLPPETIVVASRTSFRASSPPIPEQEAARMAAMKRLRHQLIKMCAQHGKPPPMAMERWLARSALHQSHSNDNRQCDPILPSLGVADPGLVQDLSRTLPHTAAQTIAGTLAQQAKAAAKAAADKIARINVHRSAVPNDDDNNPQRWRSRENVKKACDSLELYAVSAKRLLDDSGGNHDTLDSLCSTLRDLVSSTQALANAWENKVNQRCCNVTLSDKRRKGICDVTLWKEDEEGRRIAAKPYLTISMAHLQKFVQLWEFQKDQPLEQKSRNKKRKRLKDENILDTILHDMPVAEQTFFLHHLYSCLARYEALQGAGYQCAVPPTAFASAATTLGLGVTVECFASPFNCRYRWYGSAFGDDLEHTFGSWGNFFDDIRFFPISGSYQANPPFVPEIMEAMVDKLERILGATKKGNKNKNMLPLSFLVVVPVWHGVRYLQALETSPFVRAKARVAATDHSFCDGAQHKGRTPLLRPSSWDTAVVVLQNDMGSTRWPVSREQLEGTFCKALCHSKTGASLGEWERRVRYKNGRGSGTDENKRR